MAFVANELFRQDFTAVSEITVTHNLDIESLDIKVIVADIVRTDLIRRILVNPNDPTNEFTVDLISSQTGVIQVLEVDRVGIGDEAATEQHQGHLFGQYYTYAEDLTESTTTSATFQQKLRLTTPSIDAIDSGGRFLINWSFTYFNVSDEGGDVEVQVEQDDTTQLWDMFWTHCWEDDADGDCDDDYWPASGFAEITLTTGTHTFDLDFRNPGTGTARVKNVRMSFWRAF